MHDDVLMTTTFYLSLENAMTIEMIIIHKVVGAILFIIETGTHTICAHTRTLTHTHVQTFQQTIIPTANIQLGMLALGEDGVLHRDKSFLPFCSPGEIAAPT